MNIADKIDVARQQLEQIEIDLEKKFAEVKDAEKKLSEQPTNKELMEQVAKLNDEDIKLQNAKHEKEEEIASLELWRDWMYRAIAVWHLYVEEAPAEEENVEQGEAEH
ncbi:hypothetical protein L3Y34_006458 [Caenorhabditis briggsae]|uniref:Uncharacterized protein n=1 Tax=Caenorhabditis briggsae TaxID=6238 RepID=A0AAE8ZXU7_CAEBR|nr:hypothetical protein L3Y34_006458 [Caenorhabditis briggsae]